MWPGPHRTRQRCSWSVCDRPSVFRPVPSRLNRLQRRRGAAALEAVSPDAILNLVRRSVSPQGKATCPGFALDYSSMSCYRLQRNTVDEELKSSEGFNYFQKICLDGQSLDSETLKPTVPRAVAPVTARSLYDFRRVHSAIFQRSLAVAAKTMS